MDKRKVLQPLLGVLVVGAGVGTLITLQKTKPEAQREERKAQGRLVEVQRVEAGRHDVSVHAQGTVLPAERVVVVPEISGRVIWQNDDLMPGGQVKKGAVLLRIDPRDYELQIEARRADVSRAELELRLETSQQEVARREWKKFGPSQQTAGNDGGLLALREPQVKTAQVGVQSAKSALEQARLNLQKTVLKAPFNALVMSENVDEGQLVGPQTEVATLVGTDRAWVRVSVPVEALRYMRIPGRGGVKEGSEVRVWQELGGERVERTGQVLRVLPDLDPGGTMARILVGVDDPLALATGGASSGNQTLPLLMNSYVNVAIEAPPIDDVIKVPRIALREGSQVYVVDDGDKLSIRDVSVVWRGPVSVLVKEGLASGERIVTSRLAAPTEGMQLRVVEQPGRESAAEPSARPPEAKAKSAEPARTEEKL